MLIDSDLSNNFWAEVMETINYLQNKLFSKSKNHSKIICEKAETCRCQDFSPVCIFGSLALANIPAKTRSKSDYQKIWEGIIIGYSPDTSKHLRV